MSDSDSLQQCAMLEHNLDLVFGDEGEALERAIDQNQQADVLRQHAEFLNGQSFAMETVIGRGVLDFAEMAILRRVEAVGATPAAVAATIEAWRIGVAPVDVNKVLALAKQEHEERKGAPLWDPVDHATLASVMARSYMGISTADEIWAHLQRLGRVAGEPASDAFGTEVEAEPLSEDMREAVALILGNTAVVMMHLMSGGLSELFGGMDEALGNDEDDPGSAEAIHEMMMRAVRELRSQMAAEPAHNEIVARVQDLADAATCAELLALSQAAAGDLPALHEQLSDEDLARYIKRLEQGDDAVASVLERVQTLGSA